jgi:hypothetical protein
MTTDAECQTAPRYREPVILLALLGLLIVFTVWAQAGSPTNPLPPGLLLVIGVSSFGAFLLVLRRPLVSAALAGALAALSAVAGPASYTVTLVAARRYPLRTALWAALFGAVGTGLRAVWWPDQLGLPARWWLLIDVAVHAALLGWGALWRTRAELVASLRERARRAERDQEHRVEEARAAERTRIPTRPAPAGGRWSSMEQGSRSSSSATRRRTGSSRTTGG